MKTTNADTPVFLAIPYLDEISNTLEQIFGSEKEISLNSNEVLLNETPLSNCLNILQHQWCNSGCVGNTSVAVSVFDRILVLVAYRKPTRIPS